MSRFWRTQGNGPLLAAAILGMVVTFGAGWALGGATGGGEVDIAASAVHTLPAEAGSPSAGGTGVPSGLPTRTVPTTLPTGVLDAGTETTPARVSLGELPSVRKADKPPIKKFDCPKATVRVSTAAELTAALAAARPGASIALAAGVYSGGFVATRSGTARKPIYLCGTRTAVLDTGSIKGQYGLHLNGASWWRVAGFTVRHAQKGIMLDGATGVGLQDLLVEEIGDEAVHLRRNSTRNVVRGLTIGRTGLRKPKFGEGVYIGTAESNWCEITSCAQDHSDGNFVLDNQFSETSAEAVDIKEGTSSGVVAGNHFDGAGITGADSWVDVKGNGWLIVGNRGTRAPADGYQVHEIVDSFGYRNLFSGNVSVVDAAGFAIRVTKTRSGNVVRCNNQETGAAEGLTNIDCS
ncbi:MAG TPA: right-handed parallel beta-helix repeat-containing protein [Kineosporiaceae bacterium]|nr:right-handed parallel beta-helix repeat-containing protein [Kineosporiaceae bacterium]